MSDKKYELTKETKDFNGVTVYQIRALRDIERFSVKGWFHR